MLPEALREVIESLGQLPGVGPRTAERYAYYLFKSNSKIAERISESLEKLHEGMKLCPKTFALIDAEEEVSALYAGEGRDKSLVLVVEEPLDIYVIEQTRQYRGTYHVLGGILSPIDGLTPDKLRVKELLARIVEDGVREVIIATNPSVEGESTALWLSNILAEKAKGVKATRLARGLPLGVDLSYADQITVLAALENRITIGESEG